jgi:hypothetical protein
MKRLESIKAPNPVFGKCPATKYAQLEANNLMHACMLACQDPTCKLYLDGPDEIYTVVRDGQELIAARIDAVRSNHV